MKARTVASTGRSSARAERVIGSVIKASRA
jgi:hypothetical protein